MGSCSELLQLQIRWKEEEMEATIQRGNSAVVLGMQSVG